jgi:hypothetical protein
MSGESGKSIESRERAIKAANELSVAGFTVKYLEHVNIVRVDIEDEPWYVISLPEVDNYGKEYKSGYSRYCISSGTTFIELTYENDVKCKLTITCRCIIINNMKYNFCTISADLYGTFIWQCIYKLF